MAEFDKEEMKNFLKEHLKLDVKIERSYYGGEDVVISLKIDDEVIDQGQFEIKPDNSYQEAL